MTALTLRQPGSPVDHAAIRQLCRAYRGFLAGRVADQPALVENYYAETGYEDLLTQLPLKHARPDGAMFLALLGNVPVGCGMTHRINATTCEIKPVFVAPAGRGHGVATALMRAAMDQARVDGYDTMVLDTIIWLTEATALYQKLGFAPAPAFSAPPPEFAPFLRFYGRAL